MFQKKLLSMESEEKFCEMKLYSKTNLLRTQDQKIQSYF